MQYDKQWLSYDQQAERLIGRGLIADKEQLINRLKVVNYYRLSGYLFPFRNTDDTFRPGTNLELIWKRYAFDRRLRILVMDAIERIEVATRTQLVYFHAQKYGPWGYVKSVNLPKINPEKHQEWLQHIQQDTSRSKEIFVKHYQEKYKDSTHNLPLWMASEILSFGGMYTFFRGVEKEIQQDVAAAFNLSDKLLGSWLGALNGLRNICAHHGRLYNRVFGFMPYYPNKNKFPHWYVPEKFPNDRLFFMLTICLFMLNKIAPQSKWPIRLKELLLEYPEIPKLVMGFPEHWRENSLWNKIVC